ncbi:Putative ribonuclease H protein At1g65750 [Linum perenne]
MLRGSRVAVRNGRDTNFWTARWVDADVHLVDLIQEGGTQPDLEAKIADYVTPSGQWNFEILAESLRPEALALISGMSPPQPDSGEDQWTWGEEKNGKFSIKSAYNLIHDLPGIQTTETWRSVWRWKGPNRIRFFLWLATHGRLMTNSARQRRKMTDDASCSLCHGVDETIGHVLRDCRFAKEVWNQMQDFDCSEREWRADSSTWMSTHLGSATKLQFGTICWYLWKSRNERVFSASTDSAATTAARALSWTRVIEDAIAHNNDGFLGNNSKRVSDIAWEPGPSDWWVLNTDGSFNSTRGKATAGGLLRDRAGQCLFAFTSNLGSCSITRAEIRGAIQGLQLAWGKGFKKVILRMDSQAAISILTDEASPEHQHGLEVLIFREMCSRNWSVKIEHTYREGNYAADHLAALGYDYPIGNHMVSTTCNSLVYFLRRDCIGVSEPRSILIND